MADDTSSPADDPTPAGSADGSPADDESGNEDIKAKMRAALERKQGNDRGVSGKSHGGKEKAPETHGPLGGVHMHRRKAGGGGA
jgi:hypothetical protein